MYEIFQTGLTLSLFLTFLSNRWAESIEGYWHKAAKDAIFDHNFCIYVCVLYTQEDLLHTLYTMTPRIVYPDVGPSFETLGS